MRKPLLAGLMSLTLVSAAPPETLRPAEVEKARNVLQGWINGFKAKRLKDAEAELGRFSEKGTWEFRGRQEPWYRFKLPSDGNLDLYFYEEKVIKASLVLYSD